MENNINNHLEIKLSWFQNSFISYLKLKELCDHSEFKSIYLNTRSKYDIGLFKLQVPLHVYIYHEFCFL